MSLITEHIEKLESLHKPEKEFRPLKDSHIKGEDSAKLFINRAVTRHGFKSAKQVDQALTHVSILRSGLLNKQGIHLTEEQLKAVLERSDSSLTSLYDIRKEINSINVEYQRDGREMSVNGTEFLSYMVMQASDI